MQSHSDRPTNGLQPTAYMYLRTNAQAIPETVCAAEQALFDQLNVSLTRAVRRRHCVGGSAQARNIFF